MVSKAELRRYGLAERARVHQTLHGLSPEQWAAPTLCDGWTVQDLAAHLAASIHDGLLRFAGGLVLARFDVDRHNLTRAAAWSRRTPEELLAALATDRVPLILRLNPALVVVDYVVHHQDLRRPLGLPLDVPTAHLRAALQSVMSLRVFAADAARVAGYRLVATDLDWQHDSGPELPRAGRGAPDDDHGTEHRPVGLQPDTGGSRHEYLVVVDEWQQRAHTVALSARRESTARSGFLSLR